MCKTSYNNYKFFPCLTSQATDDTKIKLAENMRESLLLSFCLFSVQYFSVESPVKGNYPQKVTLMNHDIIK